jgi:conjugative transfer signal peptidase TraF
MKLLLLAAASGALVLGSYSLGLAWNSTPSMARGIWRVTALNHLDRGQAITLCLPEAAARLGRQRGYLDAGDCPGGAETLIKVAAAIPGDLVEVSIAGMSVNGILIPHSRPLAADDLNRPMQTMEHGIYRVSHDQVWVVGDVDRRSYDSRYFGPITLTDVRGRAVPFLVSN